MRRHSVRKPYLIMLMIAVALAATVSVSKYAGIFKLKRVSIAPDNYLESSDVLGSSMEQNLFSAPVEKVIDDMLGFDRVSRVDLDYRLPDCIDIRLNDIRPVALAIADNGQTAYRLDKYCRLFPLDTSVGGFDFPIITGLKNCVPFRKAADNRLRLIVEQLDQLKRECIDFYLAISSIDVSNPEFISVYLDGLPFRFITYAGALCDSIRNLRFFLHVCSPDLSGIKRLDMRSEGLIIAAS